MNNIALQPLPRFSGLCILPYRIRQQVLQKMANRELSRMRRTCSSMNKLIEDNSEQLARRAHVGKYLKIDLYGNVMFCRICNIEGVICNHSMESVSISKLSMDLPLHGNLQRIAETLRERQFVCDSAAIHCELVNDTVLEILNLINARFSIEIYLDSESVEMTSEQYTQIFTTLNEEVHNRSKFHIYASQFELPGKGLFDLFANFGSFACGPFSLEIYQRFIQDLYNSNGNTNLTYVWCNFKYQKESPFENPEMEFPATETLFDRSAFKFPIEVSIEECTVRIIRKMELGDEKYVIFMEKNHNYQNELYIVERDDRRIAELIAKNLKIERNFNVSKYISSGTEDRFHFLQQAYIEKNVADEEERKYWRSQPYDPSSSESSVEDEEEYYYDHEWELFGGPW